MVASSMRIRLPTLEGLLTTSCFSNLAFLLYGSKYLRHHIPKGHYQYSTNVDFFHLKLFVFLAIIFFSSVGKRYSLPERLKEGVMFEMQTLLRKLVTTGYFDIAILVTIIINSFVLAIQTVSTLNPSVYEFLVLIDKICISIFSFEVLLKIIVNRINYFRSAWNAFDFIIVVIALLPFAHYVSVFRALRIVRAFRLIAHVPALKRVVEALLLAIPGLMATAGLLLLIFFVFGVMGVELFGREFPQWFGHC